MGSRLTTDVDRAVEVLRNGGLVALPTETVYGLAADADHAGAVGRIFTVKGRPTDHPLIVHVGDPSMLDEWSLHPSQAAIVLAAACWPGPVTLLVPRAERVLDAVTGGRANVGLRVPSHALALETLRRFGGGLAAPSANRFGRVSPTTAAHVLADLGDDVDLVLDGGPCEIGVESTIVDCTIDPPQVLRPGAVTADEIAALLHTDVEAGSGPRRAPGMLDSHYAPRCRVVLVATADEARLLSGTGTGTGTTVIGAGTDAVEYARHLYAWLRAADVAGIHTVIAVLPPPVGLGHAIRDRLVKASATQDG